jgi:hypothetical protein
VGPPPFRLDKSPLNPENEAMNSWVGCKTNGIHFGDRLQAGRMARAAPCGGLILHALVVSMVLMACTPEPTGRVHLPVGMPMETQEDLRNVFLAIRIETPDRWRLSDGQKAPFLTYVAQACALSDLEGMRDLKIEVGADVWRIMKANFPESRAFFEDPRIVRDGYVMPAELVKGLIALIGQV